MNTPNQMLELLNYFLNSKKPVIDMKELQERFTNWQKDGWEISYNNLIGGGYLISYSKGKVSITLTGLDYLRSIKQDELQKRQVTIQERQNEILNEQTKIQKESKSIQERQNQTSESVKRAQWWNVRVLIALILATGIIASFQIWISHNQTEILEQTSMPNKAELKIKAFKVSENEKIACFSLDELGERDRKLQVYLANIGRIPTAPLNIEMVEANDLSFFGRGTYINDEEGENLGIKSGETDYTELDIKGNDNIKTGKRILKMQVRCIFCEPSLVPFEKEICIYNRNSKEDCEVNLNECS